MKLIISISLVLAILISGCVSAKPKARPRIYQDSVSGKAYLEARPRQERVCNRTCVLGFELGKSTYVEVKEKLPAKVEIREQYFAADGPFFITDGKCYDIDGLESVAFSFDKQWKLGAVNMFFSKSRFQAIQQDIATRYAPGSAMADGATIYKASRDSGPLGYFDDYIVVKETYNKHYGRELCSVNYPRLCGRFAHRSQKMVLGTSFPKFHPDKFPLL